jgi:hypothetical protein
MSDINSEVVITHIISENNKIILYGKYKEIIRYFRLEIYKYNINENIDMNSESHEKIVIKYDNKIYEILLYENTIERLVLNLNNISNYLVEYFQYHTYNIPAVVFAIAIGMASTTV